MTTRRIRRRVLPQLLFAAGGLAILWHPAAPVRAQEMIGPSTGLPIPRYVSLKSDRVNLREGPSGEHRILWVYQRATLPVEITAESDAWRKIRDAEGTVGWVLKGLLSGRRTALIAPWKREGLAPLRSQPSDQSSLVADLQVGVIGNVKKCDGGWCRIFGSGFDGYIEQTNLWGVYPGEIVD